MSKLNITGVAKLRTFSLRDIFNDVRNGVDRQALPPIPPVLAFVGFTTAVAVAGVAAQTGILASLIDAISNLISKWRICNETFS